MPTANPAARVSLARMCTETSLAGPLGISGDRRPPDGARCCPEPLETLQGAAPDGRGGVEVRAGSRLEGGRRGGLDQEAMSPRSWGNPGVPSGICCCVLGARDPGDRLTDRQRAAATVGGCSARLARARPPLAGEFWSRTGRALGWAAQRFGLVARRSQRPARHLEDSGFWTGGDAGNWEKLGRPDRPQARQAGRQAGRQADNGRRQKQRHLLDGPGRPTWMRASRVAGARRVRDWRRFIQAAVLARRPRWCQRGTPRTAALAKPPQR